MSRSKRAPSEGAERREDWLRREQASRSRSWALEEQLLQPLSDLAGNETLLALAAQLAEEQAELVRLEGELRAQALRVAELAQRLNAGKSAPPGRVAPSGDRRTVDPHPSQQSLDRHLWLCRCEGFEVDSPAGRVGVVDGLRFSSSVDQPDLLEVRAGPLGRTLLLIPVEDVDGIFSDEQRIVLRSAANDRHHLPHQLLARLRHSLSAGHLAS
jgi:hypothetical protein